MRLARWMSDSHSRSPRPVRRDAEVGASSALCLCADEGGVTGGAIDDGDDGGDNGGGGGGVVGVRECSAEASVGRSSTPYHASSSTPQRLRCAERALPVGYRLRW